MDEKIVIEYSISQKSFHRCSLTEMIARNLGNLINRVQTDYLPVMVFDNIENCDGWLEKNGENLKNYYMYKSYNDEMIVL